MKLWTKIRITFVISHVHNWPLQPFSQDYGLASHTYSLMSTPNDIFFLRSFSWQFYFLSEFLPEICWEEIANEIFFFHISFWCLTWNWIPGVSQHTTYDLIMFPFYHQVGIIMSKNASGLFTAVHPFEVVGDIWFSHLI